MIECVLIMWVDNGIEEKNIIGHAKIYTWLFNNERNFSMELLKTIKVETNCPTVWFNTLKNSNILDDLKFMLKFSENKISSVGDMLTISLNVNGVTITYDPTLINYQTIHQLIELVNIRLKKKEEE